MEAAQGIRGSTQRTEGTTRSTALGATLVRCLPAGSGAYSRKTGGKPPLAATATLVRADLLLRDMKLRTTGLALTLASLAPTSHSFFSTFRPPSGFAACQGLGAERVCRYSFGGRIPTRSMAAGEGMGGGRTGGRGRGGRGRGGSGGKKKGGKGTSKQGTLIPGPPRLENVPEEKLDEVFVFREERPGSTPRVIECYADRFAVVGGRRYMIGHPCDWAVSICIPTEEGKVEAVPLGSELMEELVPGLQRELETEDIHLFVTPITLTLQGDFLDEGEEDGEDEEDDEEEEEEEEEDEQEYSKVGRGVWGDEEVEFEVLDEGDGSYPSEEEEEEEEERVPTDITAEGVELIASYWYEDKEYALVKHLDPVFVIARQTKSGYYLLGDAEAEAVKPKVEAMLLREINLGEAMEDALGKDDLEQELDSAFKAQGGAKADLSKAFPAPEAGEAGTGVREPDVQDAEIA